MRFAQLSNLSFEEREAFKHALGARVVEVHVIPTSVLLVCADRLLSFATSRGGYNFRYMPRTADDTKKLRDKMNEHVKSGVPAKSYTNEVMGATITAMTPLPSAVMISLSNGNCIVAGVVVAVTTSVVRGEV